jgi:hypothetical protein
MKELEQLLPEVQANLGPLEQMRVDALAKSHRGNLSMLGALGGGVLSSYLLSWLAIWAAVIGGIATLIALGVIYQKFIGGPFNSYRQEFKQKFIAGLLGSIADEVRYSPSGDRLILSDYHRCELFTTKPDRETLEDTIYAKIGETDLAVSEIHTEYKQTSRDKNGKTKTTWYTIFKGLFISADFHKEFRGKTFVRSDVAEKYFGQFARFVQKPIFSSLELVQLEDPEFEKEFVVQSSNQVEARYILTPSLMQKMLELKHRFGDKVEFSFLNSRVYIAVSTSRNFFEPKLGQSLNDPETLQGFLEQVRLCLGIVEDLDLNVRIWSKD